MPQSERSVVLRAGARIAFADLMLVLSLEVARWVLMYAKRAMRCRATSLIDVYVLVVDALTEGDLDVKFLWGCEPYFPFRVEYPVK